MPAWKLLFLAMRARRGWKRIPPEQRRRLVKGAERTVRRHGPVMARRFGAAVKQARKRR
jgi:hypothetical protein